MATVPSNGCCFSFIRWRKDVGNTWKPVDASWSLAGGWSTYCLRMAFKRRPCILFNILVPISDNTFRRTCSVVLNDSIVEWIVWTSCRCCYWVTCVRLVWMSVIRHSCPRNNDRISAGVTVLVVKLLTLSRWKGHPQYAGFSVFWGAFWLWFYFWHQDVTCIPKAIYYTHPHSSTSSFPTTCPSWPSSSSVSICTIHSLTKQL